MKLQSSCNTYIVVDVRLVTNPALAIMSIYCLFIVDLFSSKSSYTFEYI